MRYSALVFVAAAAVQQVAAHGFVPQIKIGNVSRLFHYNSNKTNTDHLCADIHPWMGCWQGRLCYPSRMYIYDVVLNAEHNL